MSQSLLAIETLRLQPPIAQHLYYLSIFLAVLPEDQLALVTIVLVLSTSAIFTSLINREICQLQFLTVLRGRKGKDELTFPLF